MACLVVLCLDYDVDALPVVFGKPSGPLSLARRTAGQPASPAGAGLEHRIADRWCSTEQERNDRAGFSTLRARLGATFRICG